MSMDELHELSRFHAEVASPSEETIVAARHELRAFIDASPARRRRGRLRLAAVALAVLVPVGSALAIAETDILRGPPAPAEQESGLQGLFPPAKIGEATTLARHAGRTLFGARTELGGYCFSASSPIDPKAEGGHCVSARETQLLDDGGSVAFPMSGGSVGGYAPGAVSVRITGPGLDVTAPVSRSGWWVAAAPLPEPPLPRGTSEALVVATGMAQSGEVTGRERIFRIWRDRKGLISVSYQ
jgi:hypothetical protein